MLRKLRLLKIIHKKNRIIKELKSDLFSLRDKNKELSKIIDMYDKLSKAEAGELIEANMVIEAHENVQEMTRKELEEAYKEAKAREKTAELSQKELYNAYETIKAHEALEEMSRQKKINKNLKGKGIAE